MIAFLSGCIPVNANQPLTTAIAPTKFQIGQCNVNIDGPQNYIDFIRAGFENYSACTNSNDPLYYDIAFDPTKEMWNSKVAAEYYSGNEFYFSSRIPPDSLPLYLAHEDNHRERRIQGGRELSWCEIPAIQAEYKELQAWAIKHPEKQNPDAALSEQAYLKEYTYDLTMCSKEQLILLSE